MRYLKTYEYMNGVGSYSLNIKLLWKYCNTNYDELNGLLKANHTHNEHDIFVSLLNRLLVGHSVYFNSWHKDVYFTINCPVVSGVVTKVITGGSEAFVRGENFKIKIEFVVNRHIYTVNTDHDIRIHNNTIDDVIKILNKDNITKKFDL